jgi:TPR repeat protein
LARIYVYDMPDLEKAEQALNKAADYGHPMGKRETAQLADGYLHRGDRFYRESQGMTEAVDQEREYLDKAKQDYMHAQELYDRSGLFGDSPRNKLKAIQGQQKVEERLDELQLGYLLPKLKDLLPK